MNKTIDTSCVVHVMDEKNIPGLTVKSGETVIVETAKPGIPDETFTKNYSVEPFPKRILTITGPIFVEDAEPGDVLELTIENIELDTLGKMWMGQWMGILMDEVNHCYVKKVKVENGTVYFKDDITFPIRPMIGTIGVAPAGEAVDCVLPGDYGGNMDALNATTGSKVYLPVFTKGGLAVVGDVHAAMGYGEVLGTGIEIGSRITLKVNLIKNKLLNHPVIETEKSFEIFVSGKEDMLELSKEATRSAIAFVMERTSCNFDEAYALVGQTSDLKINQVVNYSSTISIEIPKLVLSTRWF